MQTTLKEIDHGIWRLEISGQINEQSIFPKLEGHPVSRMIVNLTDVPNANSMGILHWIRWWKDISKRNPAMSFQFENLRMPLLSCASVVAGFLPEKSEILSFYLPYHNESEGVDTQELQKKGVHYDDQFIHLAERIKRSHEGRELEFELDCVPNRDLRCLNLQIKAA